MTDDAKVRDWRIRENEQHRQAVMDWLIENGINPNDVPINTIASVTDGKLTISLWVADEQGNHQIDPDNPIELARHTITVPLKVPPTYHVELWLAPTCPTCGR
ncbi:hypothetical protein O7626_39960 [Micromonospora sp. WMMD1102]|uniref:hypothetical protein n=1 Tax=Micromonospora sp. WMMD1102 TaxID=3016105 RepID=UPI002415577B|nr:hypothetical protein [Micromonospora sp. WMMD1102]MDG4791992.1 hypothetical protein [Micromonospora sp. WMMD1102]